MMLLLQNKKTKEEYWESKEAWDTDYFKNKLQTKFNIRKRSDQESGDVKSSTVEVLTFIDSVKKKVDKVPTAVNNEIPEVIPGNVLPDIPDIKKKQNFKNKNDQKK